MQNSFTDNRKKYIFLALSLLLIIIGIIFAIKFSQNSNAEKNTASETDIRPTHFPALETVGIPDSIPSQVKEYTGFTLSFNKGNRTPNYVAWELLGHETSGDQGRTNAFWTDPEIDNCPTTKDYTRSGFSRGHLCPAADQKWSQRAMAHCFVLANICPQDQKLNAGAWQTLENMERQWAQRDSAIMIVAGPLYTDSDTDRIGTNKIRVPGAFFKAILAPYVETPRAIAFVYPNMAAPGNMQDYAMSIDDLENLTGFDFFPSLPDDIENSVEANFSFKEWNKTR